jgi:hypothetical protein
MSPDRSVNIVLCGALYTAVIDPGSGCLTANC